MRQTLFAIFAVPFVFGLSARAEDWTTTDGNTYRDVKVIKTDQDAVTIIHQDGGSLVPLATLSPDLQKRFKYDPAKAKASAAARAQADMDSIKALQAEKDKLNADKVATAQGMAKAAADSATNSANNQLKPTPAKADPLQTANGKDDGSRGPQQNDDRPHYTGM